MKIIKVLFCFSFFIFYFSLSFGQQWCWGADGRVNGKADDYTSPVATNRFGNAYITGMFSTYIIFGNDTLRDSHDNTFIVKYNSQGIVQWAENPSTSGSETSFANAIVSDADDNAYITGSSSNSLIFGTDTVQGGFFVKYSATGHVLWVNNYSGSALCIDKNGNLCLASTNGLQKFNPNGTEFMNKTASCGMVSITTDSLVNIYTTGSCTAKYDSNGNLLWSQQPILPTNKCTVSLNSVITDRGGNAYVTGFFKDTVIFGTDTLISPFGFAPRKYCLFLLKYDPNGNLLWAKKTVGKHQWRGTSLAKDKYDNIYLGGSGINSDSLLFGGGVLTLPNSSSDASFIIKLDTSGKFFSGSLLKNGIFTYQVSEFENEIAVDSSGSYSYLTGSFQGDTIFCGNDTLFDGIGEAQYIAKWNQFECTHITDVIPLIQPSIPTISLFPNPSTGIFTIAFVGAQNFVPTTVEAYNILGEKVFTETLRFTQGDNLINLSAQPNGIYLYRVLKNDGSLLGEGKIIIQK